MNFLLLNNIIIQGEFLLEVSGTALFLAVFTGSSAIILLAAPSFSLASTFMKLYAELCKPRERRMSRMQQTEVKMMMASGSSRRRVVKKPSRRPGRAIPYDVKKHGRTCASTAILSWLHAFVSI